MKINWKVRFRNPLFIVQLVLAVVTPILAYFGLAWEDMTTWASIGTMLLDAIQNPVVVVAVAVSVWNAVNDPTTEGIGDSEQALSYTKPKHKNKYKYTY